MKSKAAHLLFVFSLSGAEANGGGGSPRRPAASTSKRSGRRLSPITAAAASPTEVCVHIFLNTLVHAQALAHLHNTSTLLNCIAAFTPIKWCFVYHVFFSHTRTRTQAHDVHTRTQVCMVLCDYSFFASPSRICVDTSHKKKRSRRKKKTKEGRPYMRKKKYKVKKKERKERKKKKEMLTQLA